MKETFFPSNPTKDTYELCKTNFTILGCFNLNFSQDLDSIGIDLI